MRKLIYFIKQYVFGIIVISTSAASVIVAAYMAIQVSSYTERARLTVKENEYLSNKLKRPFIVSSSILDSHSVSSAR
jgi:hypothetical protein